MRQLQGAEMAQPIEVLQPIATDFGKREIERFEPRKFIEVFQPGVSDAVASRKFRWRI